MKAFQFSSADRRKLYSRFHTMKNKAKNAGIPFHWPDFDSFLRTLAEKVEADYSAATHRVRFDLDRKDAVGRIVGYVPDTLTVSRVARRGRTEERPAPQSKRDAHALNIYHLLMNGFEGSLEELIEAGKPN